MSGLVFIVEDGAVDVRPKFLETERNGVLKHLAPPALVGFDPGISGRIVEVANTSSGSGSDNFGKIKRVVPRVVSGDKDAADGVTGTLEETAVTEGVVARVFFGDGWDDGFDEIVLDGAVGKVCA